jgi:hypothetical protein
MSRKNLQYLSIAVVGAGVFLAVWMGRGAAQQASGEPKISAADIGGIVTAPRGRKPAVGDRRNHRAAHQIRQDRRH